MLKSWKVGNFQPEPFQLVNRGSMSTEDTLAQIAKEVSVCTNCTLHESRKKSVPGEGPANAEIMFIGEGPGFHENEQGRPFVGAAGKFLDQLLAQAGVTREEVWIGNVVKCRPPENRDPSTHARIVGMAPPPVSAPRRVRRRQLCRGARAYRRWWRSPRSCR